MPPLPVISGVVRVTMNWSPVRGIPVATVFHVRPDTGTDAEIASDIGAALEADSTSAMFNPCLDAMECSSLDLLRLDGTSATSTHVIDTITGGAGSGELIPQAAAIVSLHSGQRGPRGRGRCFVGPITEGSQANGVLDATRQGVMQSGWEAFLDALLGSTVPRELVVASYAHADAHQVTSVIVREIVGTQRRRLEALR